MSFFNKPITGRNSSFEDTLTHLYKTFGTKKINIVETGLIRGDSEVQKLGDGWSTVNWKHYADITGSHVYGVDLDQHSVNVTRKLVGDIDTVTLTHGDSIKYLEEFPYTINFLFLDSYDYCGPEENVKACHNHQLKEIKTALPKLSPTCYVLIDDVFDIKWTGKGKLSIPYLLSNGFNIVHFKENQVLLNRNQPLIDVSCVMTTYGRFTCVERSIGMFLCQDFPGNKELIIFNTDVDHPLVLDDYFNDLRVNIKIINNAIDYKTSQPYTNVGAIRRDALTHANGEYYICWDDDDIFLPWNIRQCFDGIMRTNKKAWKPIRSLFKSRAGIKSIQNTLEASIIVDRLEVVNAGFDLKTGSEHLAWYTKLRDLGELSEYEEYSIPGYCFNWSDPAEIAGHKQSGDINNPNNFEVHKQHSRDYATRPLRVKPYNPDMLEIYKPFYDFFNTSKDEFNQILFDKYVKPYLN